MKKTTNTTEEKTLLQPFPFIENEDYLLKLKNGNYVVAYWGNGHLNSEYNDDISKKKLKALFL